MTSRLTLAAFLVLLAAACGGSETYSVQDAQEAFEASGYALVDPAADPTGSALNVWESEDVTALVPEDGAPFVVFVGDPGAAGDLWDEQRDGGSAAFDARQGNVRVMAESELEAPHDERVRAALEALAD